MPCKRPRVAVIGGGVNGIASSVALLQEFPGIDLTIYSQEFSPNTTSDGAGGLWGPFISPGTSEEKIIEWSEATWNLCDSWWHEKQPGILLIPVKTFSNTELESPFWNRIPIGYRELTQQELKEIGEEYVSGHTYSAYVAESSKFLPRLMSQIETLGGKFESRRVGCLEDLGGMSDILINCSGLGARDLVPDPSVYPVRGQVMRVKYPQMKVALNDESEDTFSYIIPNTTSVVLGGTHQENDWRTEIDDNDSRSIWENCSRLVPQLKGCEVVKEWAGLRPARSKGIRVEQDSILSGNKWIPVIHNYGHGGSGITTFWGCAQDVKKMVGRILHRNFGPLVNKL